MKITLSFDVRQFFKGCKKTLQSFVVASSKPFLLLIILRFRMRLAVDLF